MANRPEKAESVPEACRLCKDSHQRGFSGFERLDTGRARARAPDGVGLLRGIQEVAGSIPIGSIPVPI